jgi:TIR domain-containing protein
MKFAKVFLCHSSIDKPFVRKLDTALRYCYISCWLDERDLDIGDSLHKSIGEAIKSCEYILPILSKNSIGSAWVIDELSAALALEKESGEKRILPVLTDLSNQEIPVFLKDRLYADFRSQPEVAIRALVKAIDPNTWARHFVRWDKYELYEPECQTHLVATLLGLVGLMDELGKFIVTYPVSRVSGYEAELEHERISVDLEEAENEGLLQIVDFIAEGSNKDGGTLEVVCQLTQKGLGILRKHHVLNRIDPGNLSKGKNR